MGALPILNHFLRRMRLDREIACDDYVLMAGEHPCDYAAELVSIARRLRAPRLLLVLFERLSGPPPARDELPPARPRQDSHASHDRRTNRAKDRDRPSRPD